MLLQRPTPRSCCTQYRPRTFDGFVLHQDVAANLRKLVRASSATATARCTSCAWAFTLCSASCACSGCQWGLPPHALLWPRRRGQEDPHPGAAARDVWGGRGEGMVAAVMVAGIRCAVPAPAQPCPAFGRACALSAGVLCVLWCTACGKPRRLPIPASESSSKWSASPGRLSCPPASWSWSLPPSARPTMWR